MFRLRVWRNNLRWKAWAWLARRWETEPCDVCGHPICGDAAFVDGDGVAMCRPCADNHLASIPRAA